MFNGHLLKEEIIWTFQQIKQKIIYIGSNNGIGIYKLEADLNCLKPNEWLNDNFIEFFFR